MERSKPIVDEKEKTMPIGDMKKRKAETCLSDRQRAMQHDLTHRMARLIVLFMK